MASPIQVHDYVSISRSFLDVAMALVSFAGIAALWFGLYTERKESR